jgi:signal peptidase I
MHFEVLGFKVHAAAALGVLALACLAAYVAFRSSVFGIAFLVFLLGAIAADLFLGNAPLGSKKEKRELRKLALEIGVTVSVAVAAWAALCVALQTSSPLNVVTSCSMLPVLERGDFVILQGGGVKAPETGVSLPLSQAFTRNVVMDAREQGKRYYLAYSTFLNGFGASGMQAESFANYSFSNCVRVPLGGASGAAGTSAGAGDLEACTSGVEVNGVFFSAANDNDVVVYEAQPAQYGLIIHRVLAKIKAPDGVFYLTKGDNNLFADQQLGISVVPESAVKGRVIGRIPLLGYFKLLLFMQFDFPEGCDKTLRRL